MLLLQLVPVHGEDAVHGRSEHTSIGFLMTQRHLFIGEGALLFGASLRAIVKVSVEPAEAVVGAEIVNH